MFDLIYCGETILCGYEAKSCYERKYAGIFSLRRKKEIAVEFRAGFRDIYTTLYPGKY